MTPNPDALAVLLDAARACYGDDSEQVRWLLNPDAVRDLLRCGRYIEDPEDPTCCDCGAAPWEAHSRTQLLYSPGKPWRDCIIAAAWRALGDPRGAADIERAHEEALREQMRRVRDLLPYTANESMVAAFATRTPLEALATQAFAGDLNVFDNIFEPVRVEPLRATQHRYESPFRLASESGQAARARNTFRLTAAPVFEGFDDVETSLDATLDPDSYLLESDHMRGDARGPVRMARFGARAWAAFQRSTSDARDGGGRGRGVD